MDGWDHDIIRWGHQKPNMDLNINQYLVCFLPQQGSFGAVHIGSFNSVFVDGSVRTINYSISHDTFKNLCSRSDGNVINTME